MINIYMHIYIYPIHCILIFSRDTHKRRAQIKPLFEISPVAQRFGNQCFQTVQTCRTYYNVILRLT